MWTAKRLVKNLLVPAELLTGTRPAKGIRASGHEHRANRPNTWPHRPMLQREQSSCQPGAIHTMRVTDCLVSFKIPQRNFRIRRLFSWHHVPNLGRKRVEGAIPHAGFSAAKCLENCQPALRIGGSSRLALDTREF